MSTSSSNPQVGVKKHFTSSILLWMRTDQPRQKGMDHWKGPHSGIIAATPGLEEYRQIHLAEANPGLWPATEGVETQIPADRKVDGVAEVTFQSALSPLRGRTQTQLAYQGRGQRVPAHPPVRRCAEHVPLVRRRRPGRARRRPSRRLPAPPGRCQWPRVPQGHQEGTGTRAHRHRRTQGTAHADVPALEREDVGHPRRRPRQPGRPALPRLAHPRVRRHRPPGQRSSKAQTSSSCRRRSPPSPRRSTPTTSSRH